MKMGKIVTMAFRGMLLTAFLSLAAPAPATYAASIAYINATGGNIDYLTSYGNTVTYMSNPIGLTLADLSGYDAVIVASNSIFSQPANIGNVVGDFADSGRGVVLTEFVFQGQWALGGKIMTAGYSPFTIDPSSTGYWPGSYIGTIYDPSSALFDGITTANLHTNFWANVGLDPGSTLVADWLGGRHAIGFNTLAGIHVVGLNLFPDGNYTTDADTRRLVANAINFSLSGGGAPVPEPSTILLLGAGLAGLGLWGRKRMKKS